jgi:hypothetical protein
MRPTHKIPELIDPHALNTTNGQEAWRVLGLWQSSPSRLSVCAGSGLQ